MQVNRVPNVGRAAIVLVALGLASAIAPVGALAHASRRHQRSHQHASAIPQHNGGDRDSDNNGHPSDGDGDV